VCSNHPWLERARNPPARVPPGSGDLHCAGRRATPPSHSHQASRRGPCPRARSADGQTAARIAGALAECGLKTVAAVSDVAAGEGYLAFADKFELVKPDAAKKLSVADVAGGVAPGSTALFCVDDAAISGRGRTSAGDAVAAAELAAESGAAELVLVAPLEAGAAPLGGRGAVGKVAEACRALGLPLRVIRLGRPSTSALCDALDGGEVRIGLPGAFPPGADIPAALGAEAVAQILSSGAPIGDCEVATAAGAAYEPWGALVRDAAGEWAAVAASLAADASPAAAPARAAPREAGGEAPKQGGTGLFGLGGTKSIRRAAAPAPAEEETEEAEAPPAPKQGGTGLFGFGSRKVEAPAAEAPAAQEDAGPTPAEQRRAAAQAAAEERKRAQAEARAAAQAAAEERKRAQAEARAAQAKRATPAASAAPAAEEDKPLSGRAALMANLKRQQAKLDTPKGAAPAPAAPSGLGIIGRKRQQEAAAEDPAPPAPAAPAPEPAAPKPAARKAAAPFGGLFAAPAPRTPAPPADEADEETDSVYAEAAPPAQTTSGKPRRKASRGAGRAALIAQMMEEQKQMDAKNRSGR